MNEPYFIATTIGGNSMFALMEVPGDEKPQQGEVVAVGPGKKTEDGKVVPVDLKVGDQVIFGQYGGNTVKVDGDELLILNESEIFGVVK